MGPLIHAGNQPIAIRVAVFVLAKTLYMLVFDARATMSPSFMIVEVDDIDSLTSDGEIHGNGP